MGNSGRAAGRGVARLYLQEKVILRERVSKVLSKERVSKVLFKQSKEYTNLPSIY